MIRVRLTFKTALAHLLVLFLCSIVPGPAFAQQATPVFGLKIKTDEGTGATTTVKSPSTEPPVVVVTDANDRPIQGAIVVFAAPDTGSSGVFEDGTRSMTVATDRDGRAAAVGYRANGTAGTYPIQIHVAFLDETADAVVNHTNVAASKSSKKLITIIAIAGGGAAAVGLLAAGHGGGGSSGSTTPNNAGAPDYYFRRFLCWSARAMMRIAQRLLVVCALLASVAAATMTAQSDLVGGPALGFSPNAEGSIVWPILGIPGASRLGGRLALGGISGAVVSPQQDYLVANRSEDGQPVLSRLPAGAIAPAPIAGSRRGETIFAISPSGPAVGLFNQDLKILQVLRGFPAAPEVAFEFDASNIAGRATALAVSDDASLALLGVSRDGVDSLWVLSAAAAGFIAPSHASSIVFLANRHDAVFADNASGLAFLLPNITNTAAPILLLNRNEGVEGLSGIGVSDDGHFAVIAGATSGSVGIVDLGTAIHTIVRCNCKPSGVHRMTGNAVFRLDEPPDSMTTLLDLSTGKPRILVIPPESNSINPRKEIAR